jgi:hypothetical protein
LYLAGCNQQIGLGLLLHQLGYFKKKGIMRKIGVKNGLGAAVVKHHLRIIFQQNQRISF